VVFHFLSPSYSVFFLFFAFAFFCFLQPVIARSAAIHKAERLPDFLSSPVIASGARQSKQAERLRKREVMNCLTFYLLS